MLLSIDREFLEQKEFNFEETTVGGETDVVIHGYRLNDTYIPQEVDLLIRLPARYPNSNPDMFWTAPEVRLRGGGGYPAAAAVFETYLNRSWQRWSRHTPEWRPVDNLQTKLASIRAELDRRV